MPEASQYSDMRSLILSTSALLQDKLPNNQGMIEMDKQQMLDNWCQLTSGLQKMAKLLHLFLQRLYQYYIFLFLLSFRFH